jgi:hypothetical protein
MAVERWRSYLQRAGFVIKTDHHRLTYLDDQELHTTLQHKAMTKMMELQFKIIYKKGAGNTAADSLSRVGKMIECQAICTMRTLWMQEIINSYATNSEAQQKLQAYCGHKYDFCKKKPDHIILHVFFLSKLVAWNLAPKDCYFGDACSPTWARFQKIAGTSVKY